MLKLLGRVMNNNHKMQILLAAMLATI